MGCAQLHRDAAHQRPEHGVQGSVVSGTGDELEAMGGRQGIDQCGESEEWILMDSDPAGDWKALNLFPLDDSYHSREVPIQALFFHFIPPPLFELKSFTIHVMMIYYTAISGSVPNLGALHVIYLSYYCGGGRRIFLFGRISASPPLRTKSRD